MARRRNKVTEEEPQKPLPDVKIREKTDQKTGEKQGVTSGFQTEIILLTILAASIILIISNLGMGGVVGAAISKASFGIMGLLAYVFPVLIFVGAAFLVSNSKNPLAYKSTCRACVFCFSVRPGSAVDRGIYVQYYIVGILFDLFYI